MDLARSNTR